MDAYIKVWPFDAAPKKYQDLSPHGGDEDWLALVPEEMKGDYIPWLDYGPFGISEITKHEFDSGCIYIGAHA